MVNCFSFTIISLYKTDSDYNSLKPTHKLQYIVEKIGMKLFWLVKQI